MWKPIEECPCYSTIAYLVSGDAVHPHTGSYVCEAFASTDRVFFTCQGDLKNQPKYYMDMPEPPEKD